MLQQRIATPRERCAAVFTARPQVRLLIEASTARAWVAPCVAAWGHAVSVAEPHDAPLDAQRRRRVKTDRRAAEAWAPACRLGASRPAHRTSERQRQVRAVRTVRAAVGQSRPRWLRVVRALRRQHGSRLRRGAPESCIDRGAARELPADLQASLEPLVRALHGVNAPAARRGKRMAVVALARRRAGSLYALWRDGRVDDEARVGQRQRAVALTVSSPTRRNAPEPRCAAGWESPGAVSARIALAALTAVGEMAPRPAVSPEAPTTPLSRGEREEK